MLAKNVNDNAYCLNVRGALGFFASKLAPASEGYAFETTTDTRQFAVILAALLWSQYEFVANR